jgi:hypothetical protein
VAAHQCLRLIPGDPEKSAVVFRMRSRSPLFQMPPLGTKIVDGEAVGLISRWLAEAGVSAPSAVSQP